MTPTTFFEKNIYHAIFVTTKLICILVHFFHEYYEKDAISTSELNQQDQLSFMALVQQPFYGTAVRLCTLFYVQWSRHNQTFQNG